MSDITLKKDAVIEAKMQKYTKILKEKSDLLHDVELNLQARTERLDIREKDIDNLEQTILHKKLELELYEEDLLKREYKILEDMVKVKQVKIREDNVLKREVILSKREKLLSKRESCICKSSTKRSIPLLSVLIPKK